MKKFWPFSFYFLYFAAASSLFPFFVIFYQELGYSGTQIGLLTGIPPLITIIAAPFGTGLADSTRRHKLVMGIGLFVGISMIVMLPFLRIFGLVFTAVILNNIFMSPIGSLGDSATLTMLGEERAMYGRIRLGGTLGWGLFAPIAGLLVQNYGLKIAFWSFSIIMAINLFVSQKFDFGAPAENTSSNGGIKTLLSNKAWIFFLLTAFLGGLGAFSVASYLYPYMAELGAVESQMGFASLIATMTELPIFFFGHRLIRRFKSHTLFITAIVLMGIRALLFSAASTPTMVYFVQALGGTMFPLLWLAGVTYADENAPAGLKSTAQGLFSAMSFGFGSAVGGFVGGILLANIGGRSMFFVFGIAILILIVFIETIRRLTMGRVLVSETELK